MPKHKEIIKNFEGYCPTQGKREKVDQTYIDITTLSDETTKYHPGLMTCHYIAFRNGECLIQKECPVVKQGQGKGYSAEHSTVFVALQFKDLQGNPRKIVDTVIRPVCADFGLTAYDVSEKEHNESITDEIMKSISSSRFVIADLTYGNNGAYYEAGYAKGQGIEVILTCSRKWFDQKDGGVHFDVQGLNLILYEDDNDFKEKLKKRIEQTCTN
jgi:hypothetical protein